MKIDLSSIDREQFVLKEDVFCGIPATLVTPAMQGTQWTQANKHLRSSIWSHEGDLLSAGFPKFTNVNENPEHFPMPTSLNDALCVEKLDGSLAIFDHFNGVLSCRTRGVFSYEALDNAADFAYCIAKYPEIATFLRFNPEYSLLCEITTPNQRVVLDYGPEIDLTFIGLIDKANYSLDSQSELDDVARYIGVKRPRYFSFSSLDHLLTDVKTWEGLEGCVIYDRATGSMHKAKADAYLRMHRFKERVSLSNLMDLFFQYGRPDVLQFTARLEHDFDHECMMLGKEIAMVICDAYNRVVSRYNLMECTVGPLRTLPRRDAAATIMSTYQDTWKGAGFALLDNKPLDDKMVRKLMEYVLDKDAEQVKVTP